jgi:formamidopyrimidine-DNA glycosylase
VPELPDIVTYIEALEARVAGRTLRRLNLLSPFDLRSVTPPVQAIEGERVTSLRRLGKRIVLVFADRAGEPIFVVLHLMIAGRLRWRERNAKPGIGGKLILASFEFDDGVLFFTEAGSRKRASIMLVEGEQALTAIDRGGIEPLAATVGEFRDALTRENHTLKRALTDPRLFSGIGNAYSDEILHAARLSPLKLTSSLTGEEVTRLYHATQACLTAWIERLRAELNGSFPEKVTAFHPGMAVHGRFGQPCPDCGAPIQRIVYADNECNYCARCQTGGRLLADRALSRLLRESWPRTLDE